MPADEGMVTHGMVAQDKRMWTLQGTKMDTTGAASTEAYKGLAGLKEVGIGSCRCFSTSGLSETCEDR